LLLRWPVCVMPNCMFAWIAIFWGHSNKKTKNFSKKEFR
jgi:hypothetical protein